MQGIQGNEDKKPRPTIIWQKKFLIFFFWFYKPVLQDLNLLYRIYLVIKKKKYKGIAVPLYYQLRNGLDFSNKLILP